MAVTSEFHKARVAMDQAYQQVDRNTQRALARTLARLTLLDSPEFRRTETELSTRLLAALNASPEDQPPSNPTTDSDRKSPTPRPEPAPVPSG